MGGVRNRGKFKKEGISRKKVRGHWKVFRQMRTVGREEKI